MPLVFDSVSSLFDYLNEIKDRYYFRGYKKADELKPGLGRCRGYRDNESRMFTDFSKLQEVRELNIDTLRRLFELGQHYGLPTRFLDWSLDPFVALYFAFGKKCEYDNKPVFMACLDRKNQQLTDIKEILDLKFTLEELAPLPLREHDKLTLSEMDYYGMEMKHPELSRYVPLRLAWQKYEQYVSGIDGFIFFSYKKDIVNLRKEAQKGVFSFHKSIDDSFPQELYERIDIHFYLGNCILRKPKSRFLVIGCYE